jgi:hypothetical protein
MSDAAKKDHHPLPADDRARHDVIPESIEDARDKGDDNPGVEPGNGPLPRTYKYPDGSPYPADRKPAPAE